MEYKDGMNTFEYDCMCESCNGSGLYIGMAEKDGAAIVCHSCKGEGHKHVVIRYRSPETRKRNMHAKRVYAANPGIGMGEGNGYTLEDFGGMPYQDWLDGKPFPKESENRKHTCPVWWYQCADYKKKPDWETCSLGVSFSRCKHFDNKAACWARWDKEIGNG